jgi:hypothetical protein
MGPRLRSTAALALLGAASLAAGCGLFKGKQPPAPPSPPPARTVRQDPLPVRAADEEVVVAAWSEPARLPRVGGQAQILVRAQKRNGDPFPGVEVRLRASAGTLYSGGRTLITDAAGHTRDRLTTRQPTVITLNAGGTVYRFTVHVASAE